MQILNNFLGEESRQEILEYCKKASYITGEKDRDDTPPCGYVAEFTLKSLQNKIQSKFFMLEKNIERSYVNMFEPSDQPYYHRDGNVWTFLYYPCEIDHIDEGGETIFLHDDSTMVGVPYAKDRLIKFDGNVMHKATSFRTKNRYTVALKFRK